VSTTALVHTMPRNYRSNSSGSLISERSQITELGFNCDSPEGGTIKKKPTLANKKPEQQQQQQQYQHQHQQQQQHPQEQQQQSKKVAKGVRFKESFATIPDYKNDDDLMDLPPPPLLPSEMSRELSPTETKVYRNIEDTLNIHRQVKSASFDLEAELECLPVLNNINKLTRRYSDESLVSNPAMLHTGTVLVNHPTQDFSSPVKSGSSPVNSGSSPVKSPEPNRPAPVLKPMVGRKPSIDKNLLARKHQMEQKTEQQQQQQQQQQQPQQPQQHVSRQSQPQNGMKQD
jgi:hypothetical protein